MYLSVEMGDQKNNLKYSGALLCDGPGLEAILQGLPLKEGYELAVNVADLPSMKVETQKLKVEGNEEFEGKTYLKLTLTNVENPAAKTTLWLDPKTKATVRCEQVLPQMGNAVLTKSLAK